MEEKLKIFEKEYIFLDPTQRNFLLLDVGENSLYRNFCFVGASGTGKTQLALAGINKLLNTLPEEKSVRLILATCQYTSPKSDLHNLFEQELKQILEEHKNVQGETDILSLSCIMRKLKMNEKKFNARNPKMYKMPVLIAAISEELEKMYQNDYIILFLDEIVCFGNKDGLDWRGLKPGPKIRLFLAFSPISHYSGKIPSLQSTTCQQDEDALRLPEDSSFFNLKLLERYRNSRKIKDFAMFLGNNLKKCLDLSENVNIPESGKFIQWIDAGNKFDDVLKT